MNMEDEFSNWQQNESFTFNETAANTTSSYTELMSPLMDKIINISMAVVMFTTMVSLGCTMELSKIRRHIMKPKGVVIAVLAQYGVMPLTAFCLAKLFRLEELAAVVVLLCGCCPGGMLSNILTLGLQGDMNLSLVMTSCSSLLALAMMPLLLLVYCRGLDLQSSVPYADIATSLLMLIVPCSVGVFINRYRPRLSSIITRVGLSFMMLAVLVLAVLTSVAIGRSILAALSPPLVAVSAIMPFTGFAFGFVISWVFGLSQPERRTVAMETGCQNAPLCMAVLKLAFPLELLGALLLFPMVYVSVQLMEAVVLIVLFRGHQRFTRTEIYQAGASGDELEASELRRSPNAADT